MIIPDGVDFSSFLAVVNKYYAPTWDRPPLRNDSLNGLPGQVDTHSPAGSLLGKIGGGFGNNNCRHESEIRPSWTALGRNLVPECSWVGW
jgi:hypothetical protein